MHGVLPLVYHTLKNYQKNIPKDVFQNIKSINMDIVKQNMLMTAELIKITKLLEEHGIESIPFKGPTLSHIAYGDITLRQYVDLDILIDKKNIKNVYDILIDNDFQVKFDKKFLNNEIFIDTNSDIQFFNKKNNILIEVHWKLFRNQFSKKVNLKEIIYNTKNIFINNIKIEIFSNEVLLVYLCMHGSKHFWERIEWILDIDKLVRVSPDLNWNKIIELSELFESSIMVNLGLYLSHKYFGTKIPANFCTKKRIVYCQMLEKKVLDIMNNNIQTEFERNFTSFKFHYYLNDNVIHRLKFLYRTFLPLKDTDISFNLPKYLKIGYFILKPFRLLIKYIAKGFH